MSLLEKRKKREKKKIKIRT